MSRLVTDHLPLLAGAPNGVKKLRELILELAVFGKLVPQSANDEPANFLLERIAALRETKILHSKVTRENVTITQPSEAPHAIPETWRFVQLGEVVEIIRGITFPASEKSKEPAPGRIACLRTANIQHEVEWSDLLYINEEFVSRRNQILMPNDIVISMANSRELVGKVAIVGNDIPAKSTFGGFLGVIRPFLIEPRFIMALLRTPKTRTSLIESASQTTNIANISLGKLRPLIIALPPLAEQNRIVAKVDELMALCDRLETRQSDAQAAHARLVDELLGSLLQARDAEDFAECWGRVKGSFDVLFTTEQSVDDLKQIFLSLAVTGKLSSSKELGNIGWHTGPFNDLIDPLFPIAYGVLVPGPETAGGVPFVRIADLSISNASAKPEKTISPDVDAKFSRTRLRGGEILMGVVGSIGKLGVAPDSWAGANIARAICRIVPNAKVCKAYMLWLLQSDVMQKQFIGDTRTLAQPTLNVGMIRSAVASIPPLAEQYRIVEKVDEFMVLCDQIKAKMARAQALNERLAVVLVERAVL